MKKIVFFAFALAFSYQLFAQQPAKYWVTFKDKEGTGYTVDHPEDFLSPRAIAKRAKFRIDITEQDLPVSEVYVRQLLAIDTNMVVMTRSKWLNGVTVYTTTEDIREKIVGLPFVTGCECTAKLKTEETFTYPKSTYRPPAKTETVLPIVKGKDLNYAYSAAQTALNSAHWLHRLGAHGEGMVICVLDAGFKNADEIPHFEAMRKEGRLLGTKNFVFPGRTVFNAGTHGTMALSCIGGYKEDEMIGTAPKASFYLAKTEDERSENKIEEDNWVAGIEWADSLGCDVLNSSLGYSKFDNEEQSYKYKDMNGRVSRATRAADIAASKGMLICVSAGNEGNNDWRYLTAPADAVNIITVGATTVTGTPVNFSSYGPTSDSRVKPDADAVGLNSILASAEGETDIASGTSFSSPTLCGMVACLWQLFPEKTNLEIIEAVRESGHIHNAPTDKMGYGVTNFLSAYNLLKMHTGNSLNFLFITSNISTKKTCTAYYMANYSATTLTVSVQMEGDDNVITQTITPKKRMETIAMKLKLPSLPKGQEYGIIHLTITDNSTGISYEQVIGATKK